jgi:hypothetical protein
VTVMSLPHHLKVMTSRGLAAGPSCVTRKFIGLLFLGTFGAKKTESTSWKGHFGAKGTDLTVWVGETCHADHAH